MHEKLMQQAMEMFDSQEKWDAFLELCSLKTTIRDKWKWGLINKLRSLFGSTVGTNKWLFSDGGCICPKKIGWNKIAMCINFDDTRGYLWINNNEYDSVKVRQMIQDNPVAMSLLKGFEYRSESDIWSKPFDKDICTYTFESSCYLWGHDTERVAKVLFETYIQPFMTDEIADFFVKVCEESKKQ